MEEGEGVSRLRFLLELSESEDLGVRKEVEWKRHPERMPKRVKKGLEECLRLSQLCEGIKGTAIDPKTGNVVTRRSLCMRAHRKR